MAAVAGGLGAAIIWAIGSIGASRAARAIGPPRTLAWVMLVGLCLMAFVLPFSRKPSLTVNSTVWLVLGGVGNVGGLLLMYRALRLGQLGVVMPIVTTEGGIAALIAIVAGRTVGAARSVALAATVLGVVLTASSRRSPAADSPRYEDRRAAGWASLAALSFGIGLYATGRAGGLVPLAWAVVPPRVVGVLAVTFPLALSGRLARPHGCIRWLLLSGAAEVGGFFAYAAGARHGIAVAAVLATLTGTFGAAIGWVLFEERLRAQQLAGIVVIFAGVAALSALTA